MPQFLRNSQRKVLSMLVHDLIWRGHPEDIAVNDQGRSMTYRALILSVTLCRSRLYADGAKETHMRIACPPLLYPCRFINFSRSKNEYDLITPTSIISFPISRSTSNPRSAHTNTTMCRRS